VKAAKFIEGYFKMPNIVKNWPRRFVFIKGFIIGSILLLLIWGVGQSWVRLLQERCLISHHVIMDALKEHVASGGQMPGNSSELTLLKYTSGARRLSLSPSISFEKERHDLKYHPDAWNKPGRIILQSFVWDSYVVTFGNGSCAVLSYWNDRKGLDEENLKGRKYFLRGRGSYVWLVLLLLLVVSLYIISTVERIMKKKELARYKDKEPPKIENG